MRQNRGNMLFRVRLDLLTQLGQCFLELLDRSQLGHVAITFDHHIVEYRIHILQISIPVLG